MLRIIGIFVPGGSVNWRSLFRTVEPFSKTSYKNQDSFSGS